METFLNEVTLQLGILEECDLRAGLDVYVGETRVSAVY